MRIGFISLKIFTLLIYAYVIFFTTLTLILISSEFPINIFNILIFINLIIFIVVFFLTLLTNEKSYKKHLYAFILSIINFIISNISALPIINSTLFLIFSFIFFYYSNKYIITIKEKNKHK